jgi:hypothetical protein
MATLKNWRAFLLYGIGLFSVSQSIAQSTAETALLFSRISNGGSARILGMGGANASLGGDFSSASTNPAGLGMFNRSEVSITVSSVSASNRTTYFGSSDKATKNNLAIPSLGFVFNTEKTGTLISSTFAITLTRLNNFNSIMQYQGVNEHNTISDFFANDSEGIDPNSFTPNDMSLNRLAYDNYLIDPYFDSNLNVYYYGSAAGININDPTDVPQSKQRETRTVSGGQNQWTAAYAVNVDDKYFFGASLHLRTIRFDSKSVYSESDFSFPNAGPGYDPIFGLTLEERLKITGSGFSGTFGVIARPFDGFQLGLAYNTPTVYTMSDLYSARLATDWNNFDYFGNGSVILDELEQETDEILADYKLKTPGRLTVGTTYFIGKHGFITGDAEFVSLSGAKYTSQVDDISYESDNANIKSLYKGAVNVRIGGEYRHEKLRFRTGFAFFGEPFLEPQNDVARTISQFSTGFGYRTDTFYLDAALILSAGKNSYRPYSVPGQYSPLVNIDNNATQFMVTLGLPFH